MHGEAPWRPQTTDCREKLTDEAGDTSPRRQNRPSEAAPLTEKAKLYQRLTADFSPAPLMDAQGTWLTRTRRKTYWPLPEKSLGRGLCGAITLNPYNHLWKSSWNQLMKSLSEVGFRGSGIEA